MIFRTRTLLLSFVILFISQTNSFAQEKNKAPLWQDFSETALQKLNGDRQIIPNVYRSVSLNLDAMQQILAQAPMRFSLEAQNIQVFLELPMPDGSTQAFKVVEAPVLHPDLGAKYPMIRAYAGQGIDDPTAFLRFDVTQKGFHAMILTGKSSTVFIDPYAKNDTENYISYYKKDFHKDDPFECETVHEEQPTKYGSEESGEIAKSLLAGDCTLRKYRLALACTGEYAQYHGGTVAGALAAMNTSMVRINGVYERDATITMEIIADNEDIIFLNGNTDPYSNGNGGAMLGQNQTTCDNNIGSSNYDIGHVFSTGGGGIASLNSPCSNNNKAKGVTGSSNPVGDPFDIDYVAHEMGHQYGGNHTQNNDCNNVNGKSVEPGSASTIMGYAGICAPNVQNNSDDYFHIINLREMAQNVVFGTSSNCPEEISTGNNAPTAYAGSNYTIPVSTPFVLTGEATDNDGTNSLTYCWEQMDPQSATMPPSSGSSSGPSFRSKDPIPSPSRYCPPLDDVINGNNPTWEVLPAVGRTMKFTFTVRDNNLGSGCTADDDMVLTFAGNAGPFLVTNPNTNITWQSGNNETITWDVANTNQSPVSCANVDILMSVDGGYTYPITLAEDVPNTGNYDLLVPNIIGDNNRILIQCSDNIFYDISNTEFSIEEGSSPDFIFSSGQGIQTICADEEANYSFEIDGLGGFNDPVTFVVNGLPEGATATFDPITINPDGTTTMNVSGFGDAAAGTYNIEVTATSSSITKTTTVTLILTTEAPGVAGLQSPANGVIDQASSIELNWEDIDNIISFQVQLATSPNFEAGSIVESGGALSPPFSVDNLQPLTVYYWRVIASNDCGQGGYSEIYSFQTGGAACQSFENNTEMIIATNETAEVISIIEVQQNVNVTSVTVNNLDITHAWIGDLHAILYSPQGTTINLFDRPGFPEDDFGCGADNMLVGFDDTSPLNAFALENECGGSGNGDYAIEGIYRPIDPLSNVNTQNAQGDWTLQILDYINQDGGQLNGWGLTICYELPVPVSPELGQQTLLVATGGMETISNNYLNASVANISPGNIIFTIISLPVNGTLTLNGTPLDLGDTFTQADIDSGLLEYMHDGSDTDTDAFNFEVLSDEGGWNGGNIFNINIVDNTLAASVDVVTDVTCNGNDNGQIEVAVSGGTGPYQYSLDGENFQEENIFDNLAPGTYTVTILDEDGNEITTSSVEISNPEAISGSASVDESEITVTADGGTGNLEYSIDGLNFQDSNIFPDLANGSYTITIIDENECTTTVDAIVAVNALIASIELVNDISCNNENDGTISVAIAGGMGPYMYSLNGGAPQSDNVFNNLEAGTYTVVVTDAQGFEIETTGVVVTNPEPLSASASVDEYEITVTAGGGSGTLLYSIDGINYQASNVFSDLNNGSYTISVIDENECITTTEATVAVNALVANIELENDISCNNENDGTISVAIVGGIGPYMYSLNGGTPQSDNVFTGLEAGTYTVVVTDAQGFEIETTQVVVTNPPPLSTSASVDEFEITVTAGGGSGTLLYSIDGINYQASNIFSDLDNGSYTISVIDENECIATTDAIVAVNALVASIELENDISCNNANDGTISVAIAGGIGPYMYSLNGGTPQSDNVFTNLEAGTYTVVVTDALGFEIETTEVVVTNPAPITASASVDEYEITITADGGAGALLYSIDGVNFQASNVFPDLDNGEYIITILDGNECETSIEATVAVNPLVVGIELEADISCNNANDGIIVVEAFGGMMPYTYSLNGGTPQSDNVFTNLEAGIYTVVVIDANDFEIETSEVEVTNPTPITATATVAQDEITITAAGGEGSLLYSIDGINFQASNVFSDLGNDTYTITVIDENQCETFVEATVSVNTLTVSAALSQNITCAGENNGIITVDAIGGEAPFSYSLDNETFQDDNVFEGLSAGEYTITVIDNNGFIQMTGPIEVSAPNAISINPVLDNNNLSVNTNGGTGDLMYSIDGINYGASNSFSDLDNGMYTVYVIDENECLETIEIEINIIAVAAYSIQTLDCADDENGVIEVVSVEGGIPPYTYSLNGGTPQSSNTFNGLGTGTYVVLTEDSNGSSYSSTITLSNPEAIEITMVRMGNSLTINTQGGVGSLQYSIDGGATFGNQNAFSGLENGTYEIVVMDSNGCQETDTITVMVNGINDLDLSLSMNLYPNPNAGNFVLTINQPTSTNLKLDIYDTLGRLVYKTSLSKPADIFEHNIAVEHLASGTYFLRVTDGQMSGSKRVMVVK